MRSCWGCRWAGGAACSLSCLSFPSRRGVGVALLLWGCGVGLVGLRGGAAVGGGGTRPVPQFPFVECQGREEAGGGGLLRGLHPAPLRPPWGTVNTPHPFFKPLHVV